MPGCGRPTNDFLCTACVTELVTALRELAFGMTSGGQRRPGLADDLQAVVARLTTRRSGLGVVSRSAETALPFHAAASELAWVMDNTLSTWAWDFAETHRHLHPRWSTVTEAAEWMASYPNLLALHPAAEQMHDEITHLVHQVRSMVDIAPERIYLGPCGEKVEGVVCTEDLYALPSRTTVHCGVCGAAWNVEERREWLLEQVEDQLATAPEIARALPTLGQPVSVDRIRVWAHRGELSKKPAHPLDPRRRPRYRIGDVLDLITRMACKHAS